jgi:putative transposase
LAQHVKREKETCLLVAEESFSIAGLVKVYGKHPSVSTDGDGTWYPQACRFLRLSHHHLHSPFEKSIIERTMQ